jgi:hypothetical protein
MLYSFHAMTVLALYTEQEQKEYGIYLLSVAIKMPEYLALYVP